MATVYVSEYVDTPVYIGQSIPAGNEAAVAEQHIAITGASTQGAAFNAQTKFVRVHVDAICSIAFGPNPTATVTVKRMAANATEFFGVRPGDTIAVIANT